MNEVRETRLGKWRRFRNRSPEDRILILRAALILPLTEIGLRVFGFRRWSKLVEKLSKTAKVRQPLPEQMVRDAALRAMRAVRTVELHGPIAANCLERSMALWWLLRREGAAGELHIGARKERGRFEAHAWVEIGGQVLNDVAEVHQHYARFDAPIAVMAPKHDGSGFEFPKSRKS